MCRSSGVSSCRENKRRRKREKGRESGETETAPNSVHIKESSILHSFIIVSILLIKSPEYLRTTTGSRARRRRIY